MANTTTGVNAFEDYFNGLVSTADETTTPLRNMFAGVKSTGDSYVLDVKATDNASTTSMTDGGVPPAAGSAVYQKGEITYAGSLLATTYELTGNARDYARDGRFDLMTEEFNSALAAHLGKVEDGLIVDIEAAIDSAGSYAGMVRATYKLASYESESAASALVVSDMETMDLALRSTPVSADMAKNIILSAVDRRQEYLSSAVGTGAGDARVTMAKDNAVDAGLIQASTTFNGKPWFDISRMTAGTVLELNPELVVRNVIRPITVDLYGKTKDAEVFVITSQERLIIKNPRQCGKIIAFV